MAWGPKPRSSVTMQLKSFSWPYFSRQQRSSSSLAKQAKCKVWIFVCETFTMCCCKLCCTSRRHMRTWLMLICRGLPWNLLPKDLLHSWFSQNTSFHFAVVGSASFVGSGCCGDPSKPVSIMARRYSWLADSLMVIQGCHLSANRLNPFRSWTLVIDELVKLCLGAPGNQNWCRCVCHLRLGAKTLSSGNCSCHAVWNVKLLAVAMVYQAKIVFSNRWFIFVPLFPN